MSRLYQDLASSRKHRIHNYRDYLIESSQNRVLTRKIFIMPSPQKNRPISQVLDELEECVSPLKLAIERQHRVPLLHRTRALISEGVDCLCESISFLYGCWPLLFCSARHVPESSAVGSGSSSSGTPDFTLSPPPVYSEHVRHEMHS